MIVRQGFEPSARRVIVMRARIRDGIVRIIMRQMWIICVAVESELKDVAISRARNAQDRARYLAGEYPLHVIAGVAALAFVAGFGLRLWRGSRD